MHCWYDSTSKILIDSLEFIAFHSWFALSWIHSFIFLVPLYILHYIIFTISYTNTTFCNVKYFWYLYNLYHILLLSNLGSFIYYPKKKLQHLHFYVAIFNCSWIYAKVLSLHFYSKLNSHFSVIMWVSRIITTQDTLIN